MADKITQATWDSIGREILKDSEGITNLVHNVLHKSYEHPRMTLSELAEAYCRENGCITPYNQEREMYLIKHKIPYRDAAKKFNKIYGQAINYLIVNYMKKHKYVLSRERDHYTGNYHLVLIKRD